MFGRTDEHTDTRIVFVFYLFRLFRDVSYDIWPQDERHEKAVRERVKVQLYRNQEEL